VSHKEDGSEHGVMPCYNTHSETRGVSTS